MFGVFGVLECSHTHDLRGGRRILSYLTLLPYYLTTLLIYNVTALLLEGGTTLHRAAGEGGLVDRLQRFVAPVDLGQGGLAWLNIPDSALSGLSVRQLGPDVLTEGYVYRAN